MSAIAVPHIELPEGPLSGEQVFEEIRRGLRGGLEGAVRDARSSWKRSLDDLIRWAGFSNFEELEVLDSIFGDHATINLNTAPTYLALTTVAVGETDTGSTLTEANYTGYARLSFAAADMTAAAAGSKSNTAQKTFAACTAGSSTIIGWAQCTALTVGNVIVFGTCTSTVISTTQTPGTVAAAALVANLD
ncbi:MAG: hypothetical protein LC798_12735 [Chloroflexi bacterium]|nr:hypothetical protein [Chloroflexota bacterium]